MHADAVIYKAAIENPKAFYIGMTAGKFKNRYNQHIYTKKGRLCRLKATVNRSITSSHVCKQKSWFTGSRGAKNRIDLVEDRESVFFYLSLLNEPFFKSLKSAQKKFKKI